MICNQRLLWNSLVFVLSSLFAIMNRFYKNFILYGDIDYCCILCNEAFDTLDSAEKHIRWEQHRKVLRNQVKMTKFKKDSIYKVRTKSQFCLTR